jgi:hypothetical protein
MCCGRRKEAADAHHDPDNRALQRVLGDSQRSQAGRRGRLRLAPPQTALFGQRNRPARFKSDGLLEPLFNERLEIKDGRMLVPTRPGLGLSLSEQAARWTRESVEIGNRA